MPRGRNLPPLLAQASSRTGDGASLLFHKLDPDNALHEQGAEVFTRLAERLHAGAWNSEIAELVSRAEVLLKALGQGTQS
jgi:hypothetical protein